MDNETLEALRHVVEYIQENEKNDYEATADNIKPNHVYASAMAVADWLNQN